jgi:lysozyme family protein
MQAITTPPAIVGAAEVCPNRDDEMKLTDELRREYEELFANVQVRPEYRGELAGIVARISRGIDQYQAVSAATGTPWFVIALLHNMECGGRFDCHLHNGDSLLRKTVNVPENRPVTGEPPFSWFESAVDAITYEGFPQWSDWSLPGVLFKMELYNGLGSRAHGVHTPYLWSRGFEDLDHDGKRSDGEPFVYVGGKYVKDRVWDPKAQSGQIGAAVILKQLVRDGIVSFE